MVADAVKVMGLPASPMALAVSELLPVPAPGPSVQLVRVATPAASVLTTAGLAGTVVPPPAVMVKVTPKPETGFPLASVTLTEGGAPTAVPAVALCEVALFAVIVRAAPAPSATPLEMTSVRLGAVKRIV